MLCLRILLLVLLGWVQTPGRASERVIPFCEDANEWPPYTHHVRKNGERSAELTGFSVELLRLIGARRGFVPRVVMLPWKRCLAAVQSGEMAGLLNAVHTPERARDFLLSPVIYETRLLLLGRSQRFPKGLDLAKQTELLDLRVGGLHGYSYSQLEAIAPERIVRAPNYGSLLQMLRLDRLDVALINEGVLMGLVTLQQLPPRWDEGLVIGTLADRQPSRFHMMFSRHHPHGEWVQQSVTEEWAVMQRDGTVARMRAQWLKPPR